MTITEKNSLIFYQFEILNNFKISQGIFTRHGGVSPAPWDSLNLGGSLGDERANIVENRRRIFSTFQRPLESLFDVWQVHGTDVFVATEPRPLNGAYTKGDAILTNRSDVTLFMRFADCVPICFYDPIKNVIGIAHAGWKGTVAKIAARTVQAMRYRYHSNPQDIVVGIGPSIGPDHYEVGSDVVLQVEKAFGADSQKLIENKNSRYRLNLWEANRLTLLEAGVREIQIAGLCTACNRIDWFSHRADQGKTGRFGALLALK